MASVNVDKLSELLDLEGKIEKAIAAARDREHGELKQDLAAFAEKRGFSLTELFGGPAKARLASRNTPTSMIARRRGPGAAASPIG
jgi:DNA-binding protein H-NS